MSRYTKRVTAVWVSIHDGSVREESYRTEQEVRHWEEDELRHGWKLKTIKCEFRPK